MPPDLDPVLLQTQLPQAVRMAAPSTVPPDVSLRFACWPLRFIDENHSYSHAGLRWAKKGGCAIEAVERPLRDAAQPAPGWQKFGTVVCLVLCLLASGLMIAASFMPWLGFEGGRTLSGWDIYDLQRDSGNSVFAIPDFFTDPEGRSVAFFTGLATLISGLCLAGLTIVVLALFSLLRKSLTPESLSARLVMALVLVLYLAALMAALSPSWLNAMAYSRGGDASGASLEYGLILLWAATVAGFFGSLVGFLGNWWPVIEAGHRARLARGRRTP